MKKKIVAILFFSLCASTFYAQVPDNATIIDKDVLVISTAADTDLRLTPTDTLAFAPFGQPFENEPCLFIDPRNSFQTFLGIGGALTDAAAETFYKLPVEQQETFMESYFTLGPNLTREQQKAGSGDVEARRRGIQKTDYQ